MTAAIRAVGLSKTFTLHTHGGTRLPVFHDISFQAHSGECVCLHGPSGAGKSTLLRSLYGNYRPQLGSIFIEIDGRTIDILAAEPWEVIEVRRRAIGYVSQFLRVIPRVSALDVVAEPALNNGTSADTAYRNARELLSELRIPARVWNLAPATFSGGEQQRVNIARGFMVDYKVLLLDEPTASLDAENRATVVKLIKESKRRGAAIIGIFHDNEVRDAVADRIFEVVPLGNSPAQETVCDRELADQVN
jgi:alpha-D-ribose 1-methylphosphonate 5-triphosphate synthase subunit PhnL